VLVALLASPLGPAADVSKRSLHADSRPRPAALGSASTPIAHPRGRAAVRSCARVGAIEHRRRAPKAMWRLDSIGSENAKGFHADQQSMWVLGESIDHSRRAQALAMRLRTGPAPSIGGSRPGR